jgi:hypothetical protein
MMPRTVMKENCIILNKAAIANGIILNKAAIANGSKQATSNNLK